jgi:uncharacterized protein (DUF362 family)/Pyruvate/2-oxoacid:ferredoxin oxidoreductase delta subunit
MPKSDGARRKPSRVAVIACPSYDALTVSLAVKKGLAWLGGASAFVQPGEKILLKPNMLAASAPEKAVTTHPAVFKAAAEIFLASGGNLSYGDSPGIGNPRRTAARCGIMRAANELGIPMADFVNPVQVSFPEALLLTQMQLAAGAVQADGIISLPKMKTHALTLLTGAIKNQFGCVPGLLKNEFHVKMPDIRRFSQVLVDISRFLRPRLYIMDGIQAMSGNGPRGGDVFAMNVLLFSDDPVAMDAVFCQLTGIDPEWMPIMKIARESGLGTYHRQEIEILGDDILPLIRSDFPVTRRPVEQSAAPGPFPPLLKRWLSARPIIDRRSCRHCGDCISKCPVSPKALTWADPKNRTAPVYDYSLCIRCYCCQEICPAQAISVRAPWLERLVHRLLS